jgi:hypothetical protein
MLDADKDAQSRLTTGALPSSWLIFLAVTTFVVHLVFGIYYATKIGSYSPRPTLAVTGLDYLRSFPGWDSSNELDSASNNRAAISVLQTGVPRSREGVLFLRAPVYAYFVAASYAVGGVRLLPVAMAQSALSALICLLLGLAARRISSGGGMAWVMPPLLYFLNLRVAMHTAYVIPLILPLFFTAVMLWAATWPADWKQVGWIAISIVLGMYSQAAFFVVGSAVAIWLAWRFFNFKRNMDLVGAVVILLFVGLKFPLTWLDVAGKANNPARADDRGGTLWLANNPYYENMKPWSLWELRPQNPWSEWKRSDQEQQRYDDYLTRANGNELKAALLWMRENPFRYATLCAVRLRTDLGPFSVQMSPRNRQVSTVVWLLIFPAGFYGLWKTRAQPVSQLVLLILLAVLGFNMLFIEEGYLRYRMPVDLALTALAGVGYSQWLSRFRRAANSPDTAVVR